MISRTLWQDRLDSAWQRAPIVWLTGVRRVGKTTLALAANPALGEVQYFNCDLPSVVRRTADPEQFLRSLSAGVVVLDEVHQLDDPSRLLKIAADGFPALKVLATGSSTLAATAKFRDSLTGRKRQVHLLPVLHSELPAFNIPDLRTRLFRGGLPPALLHPSYDPSFYAEWLDSYFARDVQELFKIEKRAQFLKLLEAVLRLSGGATTAQTLATLTGLTRPTLVNYLEVLEITLTLRVVRPHFGNSVQELVKQPKLYGFDTGFVCFTRGIESLRDTDCGALWEHLVLDTLSAEFPEREVRYWRDKQGYEIDFVLLGADGAVHAIECKWNVGAFEPAALQRFRALYPIGKNLIISPNAVFGMEHSFSASSARKSAASSSESALIVHECGLDDVKKLLK
jgi:uncharacterized protein